MHSADEPRRPRLFYGWIIVLVSAVADATAFGAGTASFSVFLQPMSAALGWSRSTLTGAATFSSLANILVTPVIGPLLDRHGPRVIMVFGTAVAGIAYLLMGKISEPWQYYLLFTAATSFGLHEVGGLVGTTTVAKWFTRKRGRALAFTSAANNFGGIILAPVTAFLISSVGWGAAWAVLGAVIVLIVLPPTIVFMRRSPEDMGLLPDGEAPAPTSGGTTLALPRRPEPRWEVRDALRTPTLWMLILASNLAGLGISALLYHQVAYFRDAGFSLEAAALAYSLYNAMAMLSKLLWGFLAERVPARYCLMGNFVLKGAGWLALLLGSAPERVYVYAVVSGLGTALGALQPLIWADYYGRAFLGTIRGVTAPFQIVASLGGPLFAAVVFDLAGSYDAAFWVFTVTVFLAAGLIFFARPPGAGPERASTAGGEARTRTTGELVEP